MTSPWVNFRDALESRGFSVMKSECREKVWVDRDCGCHLTLWMIDVRTDWEWAVGTVLRRYQVSTGEGSGLASWLIERI